MWLGLQKSTISAQKITDFYRLLYYNLTIYTTTTNVITTAEFNGLSFAAYQNEILYSKQKILAKIKLGVICTHMVNFCRPGHIYISLGAIILLLFITNSTNTSKPMFNNNFTGYETAHDCMATIQHTVCLPCHMYHV